MAWSTQINEKLERYKAFYNDPKPGQVLITIPPYTFNIPACPSLNPPKRDRLKETELIAEDGVKWLRYFMDYTKDIDDDYIPDISPLYGIGLNSAYFSNAEVVDSGGTTWVEHVCHSLKDIDKLQVKTENPWMQYMLRFMKRACEMWEGDYAVSMLGAFAPSDMALALRGNDFFYELYDDEDMVDYFLDKCRDAIFALYNELKPYQMAPEDGFVAGGLWIPGTGMFLSEDAADLCSPEIYNRFFKPQTQKLINQIGGAYIHHHAKGWQIHKEISSLKSLRFLEFSWDPNCPRPIDNLDELLELSLAVPLQTRCTLTDLKKYAPLFKEGRIALMVNVDTLDEAKEAVRIVRKVWT